MIRAEKGKRSVSPLPEADMSRQDICDNRLFKDLPFKVETDRRGHIVMSPATDKRSRLQGEVLNLLRQAFPHGRVLSECSVQTCERVKVADAVWASSEFFARHGSTNPYPEAPEIVIEVLSVSNGLTEMEEKSELYFAGSARILGVPGRWQDAVLQRQRQRPCLARTQNPCARLSDPP